MKKSWCKKIESLDLDPYILAIVALLWIYTNLGLAIAIAIQLYWCNDTFIQVYRPIYLTHCLATYKLCMHVPACQYSYRYS